MQYLYISICLLCINAFISEKINTQNLFKKLGLLMIIVGALIDNYELCRLFKIANPFTELGVLSYLISEFIAAHFRKHNSRHADRKPV